MPAKLEFPIRSEDSKVWIKSYEVLHNLPHWHMDIEVIACSVGQADVFVDGHYFPMKANNVIVCKSGSIHSINTVKDGVYYVAQFDPSLVERIVGSAAIPNGLYPKGAEVLRSLSTIHDEVEQKRNYYQKYTEVVAQKMFLDLLRCEGVELSTANNQAGSLHRYKDLLAEINRSYEFISFQDAAAFMNMSETYFSRFFKKICGMSFSNYLNAVKIDKAVELLHTDPDISSTDLMLQCGFNTLRHFYRVFHDLTGYSPKSLPKDFKLNIRVINENARGFDPTLPSSVVIS